MTYLSLLLAPYVALRMACEWVGDLWAALCCGQDDNGRHCQRDAGIVEYA